MIESLTPEQEARLDRYAEEEIAYALGGDSSYDAEEIAAWIHFLYDGAKPEIVICKSPHEIIRTAKSMGASPDLNSVDPIGIGYDLGWTSFYRFMESIGVDFNGIPFAEWCMFRKGGVWASLLFEHVAFVCVRPSKVKLDENHELHNASGQAIEWPDGEGFYFLHGVRMEKDHVMTPAEKLDPKTCLLVDNVEVRRELIRKIGVERLLSALPHKVIDQEGNYSLLTIDLDESLKDCTYLKMKNPSIGTWHIEGVDSTCRSVQEAIDWRARKKNWKPSILT